MRIDAAINPLARDLNLLTPFTLAQPEPEIDEPHARRFGVRTVSWRTRDASCQRNIYLLVTGSIQRHPNQPISNHTAYDQA